jgi:hypothetical protein
MWSPVERALESLVPLVHTVYHVEQEITSGSGKPKAEPKTIARRANQPRPNLTGLGRRPNGLATRGSHTAATGPLTIEFGINLKAIILKQKVTGTIENTDGGPHKHKDFLFTHRIKVQAQNVCTILEETTDHAVIVGLKFETRTIDGGSPGGRLMISTSRG